MNFYLLKWNKIEVFRLSTGVQEAMQVTMPDVLKVENVADQKQESLTRVIFSKIITMRVNTAETLPFSVPWDDNFCLTLKCSKNGFNLSNIQPMFWLYVASLLQNILE